ncbi:MAG TPA: hypothetical protein VGE39_26545 [Prosthecobacter sp.]
MKFVVLERRSLGTISVLLAIALSSSALDPFYPEDEYRAYLKRVLEKRELEQPWEGRPAPGKSPIVAIQTAIMPDFSVDKVSIMEAFAHWSSRCDALGIKLSLFVDHQLAVSRDKISYAAKGETSAKVLSWLLGISGASLRINGKDLLIGHYGAWALDPYATGCRTWVLSEELAQRLFQEPAAGGKESEWMAADAVLQSSGVPLPAETFADYRPDIRALVVVNRLQTLKDMHEWIREAESEFVIKAAVSKGRQQMEGYVLEVRPLALDSGHTKLLRRRLFQGSKLAPLAANAESLLRSFGMLAPKGSAAWLDVEHSTLWLLNRPDEIEQCARSLDTWLDALEKN